jgi:hypothetical protein
VTLPGARQTTSVIRNWRPTCSRPPLRTGHTTPSAGTRTPLSRGRIRTGVPDGWSVAVGAGLQAGKRPAHPGSAPTRGCPCAMGRARALVRRRIVPRCGLDHNLSMKGTPRCWWGYLSIPRSRATGIRSDREDAGEPALANAVTSSKAGLYRSEPTIDGVTYLAGWVVPDSDVAATPAASVLVGGGILKPRTHQLLTAPALTSQDISAGQVMVSGLGTFALTQCHSGTCS